MGWIYLIVGGILEIIWAIFIKHCNGLKISLPLLTVVISLFGSMFFLKLATETIPISIAYAAWAGIGIAGVFLYGVVILNDPLPLSSFIFVIMILVGIIGLKLGAK